MTAKTEGARRGRVAKAVERACFLCLVFGTGSMFGVLGLPPSGTIADGLFSTVRVGTELMATRPPILIPPRHAGDGVVVNDPIRASPGLTLVQGVLDGGPQVRLIDGEGRELNRWTVDFFEAWPDPAHVEPRGNVPASTLNYHTQGFAVRPDGTMLVNVAEKGAILMDRCGTVLGTVDRMTHHVVTPSGDGGYWLPAHRPVRLMDERLFPPGMSREALARAVTGRADYPENTVLKVDADGRPVAEFSVLGAIVDAGLEAAVHDARGHQPLDPTHLNDIEIVTPALAARIPEVEPGDLLLSLRTMNMLAIIGQRDGALKWHRRGPWVRQHDPDITADGMIELYNNRAPESAAGGYQSQVLRYDPTSDTVSVLHPRGADDRFASEIMGTHQLLPSGNRLITESVGGRVFEATPDGEIVWSYVLAYDEDHAALITSAERVAEDFFDVRDWTCEPDKTLELASGG